MSFNKGHLTYIIKKYDLKNTLRNPTSALIKQYATTKGYGYFN